MVIGLLQHYLIGIPDNLVLMFEIGFMLIIASVIAFFIRIIKQPLIPAYIVAGILIGPLGFGLIKNQSLILSLSEMGIAFLIFIAGLEIKFKKLKEVGWASSVGGVLQIGILFALAFFISIKLGFVGKAPIYIGLAVAFSSTMVVFKLLSDRKELDSLHGRIIIGILLIQDLVAIVALTILTKDLTLNGILISLGKALIFITMAFTLSKLSNPIFRRAAKNPELLLLMALSFLFLFILGAFVADMSLVIGAFFAGVALANSDYKTEIEGKIRPIRDFFAVIFFVALGIELKYISYKFSFLLLILLGLVLIIKPLIIMLFIRIFGYKKRTSFLTGNALAQTSEFSLILATLGFGLHQISEGLFSTLILLTILTMTMTTYSINYEKILFRWFSWPLNILKSLGTRKEDLEYLTNNKKRIILFGCHRMGSLFLKEFTKKNKEIIVVDYNPEIIQSLINKKIPCIYGDFINEEILEKVNIPKSELIISTIPDLEDNLLLIKKVKELHPKVPIFVVGNRISEALKLYEAGASYVILPQVLGGKEAYRLVEKINKNKISLKEIKKEHLKYLDSIHKLLY